MGRLIRRLFIIDWRREPTTPRVLASALLLTAIWGTYFGLLDGDIWTVGNWAYSVFVGCTFVVLLLVLRRLDRWARRRESA